MPRAVGTRTGNERYTICSIVKYRTAANAESMDPYQVVWEFEWEVRYGFSRSVISRESWVAREIPRFNHVGIVLMKDSVILVS